MLFDRLTAIVGNGSGTTAVIAALVAMLFLSMFTTACFTLIVLKAIGKR
jgi:hypothetical protein